MTYLRKISSVIFIGVMVCFIFNKSALGVGEDFQIFGGSTTWGFYDSGYSDGFHWGIIKPTSLQFT